MAHDSPAPPTVALGIFGAVQAVGRSRTAVAAEHCVCSTF